MSRRLGRHAVVIGASMGGLLAARALAEHFGQVTVLERDRLPAPGKNRKGVPQGQHAHGLLGRGREVLERFFPGLTRDLVAKGAVSSDLQDTVRWYSGGAALAPGQSGLIGLGVSRPLLEGYVRERLLALPRVRLVESCAVAGLLSSAEQHRVYGVRLARSETSPRNEVLEAELVVDAGGRGSQSRKWLAALGYGRPPEEIIEVGIGYATAHFRRGADEPTSVVVARSAACPRGAALIAQEGDRWVLSLGGFAGDHPPTDFAGFVRYAKSLPAPEIHRVVEGAEPVGPVEPFRYPASVRRHYQKLARFPAGYLVFGDALCSFNPVYGQGMTSAALQALALGRELGSGLGGLAPRFFGAASRVVDIPWQMAAGQDLNDPRVKGRRTLKMRLVNAYLGKLTPVAWRDPAVARAFLEVTNLVAPPASLMRPAVALRVLQGNLATSGPARSAAPSAKRGESISRRPAQHLRRSDDNPE